jgi:hypothetical protein
MLALTRIRCQIGFPNDISATVKANDMGADLGGPASVKKGFKAYPLTDAGISDGVTYQTRRFSPIPPMNSN